MTYEEFCNGVEMKIDAKCYERIEAVYMAYDRFSTKQDICDFYNAKDMNGVENLWAELHRLNNLKERAEKLGAEISAAQTQLDAINVEITKSECVAGIN